MAKLNPHFSLLKRAYIFPIIEEKLEKLKGAHPSVQVLNFGIGDIALPLAPSVAKAISDAAQEMTTPEGMKGYGPSSGYRFLKEAIAKHEFSHLGISPEEILISDGANSDTVNIAELFSSRSVIAITDPTYPAYLDSNRLAGRNKILSIPCLEENRFAPQPPKEHCDLIYLCTPNNPTGMAMNRSELEQWVAYALREKALLLVDNAYEAFITSRDVPHSIFEIPGAKECAIEFRSFSKSAGFTGLRCAYAVIPNSVCVYSGRKKIPVRPFFEKRQSIKFNGVAYPIQKGAEAVYTLRGKQETREQVDTYLAQATLLREGLKQLGHTCYGGVDAPYLFWKTPQGVSSWDFFDTLLEKCHLISIPGIGFGPCGEGYVRLSAFTTAENAKLALNRLQQL